jgi:hypothetical protein
LWYKKGDEIIHVEIETGSDKKIQIVTPEKGIGYVNTDTQAKNTDMYSVITLFCHQPCTVFPDCRQFVTDDLTEGDF